jgi:radical SAM superfamily enzyme YgiQ (UPF0313 family)
LKVLLISPNTLTVPYPVYPLGLDYVAGAVDSRHELMRLDLNVDNLDGLAQSLADFQPDVIGISCRNIDNTEAGSPLFFIEQYADLVAWLRTRTNAVLVCGGSGFTIMPERVYAALKVDYGIVGEGERFASFLGALERGQDPETIPGVLGPSGQLQLAGPWQGERSRILMATGRHRDFYVERGGMLNLQTKRGCSFRCIYCPYPHIEGRRHRVIPAEEVAQTACELEQAGAKYLFITDSAFNSDVNHSLAVAKAFRAAGLSIPWGAFFAPIKSEDDYFQVMAQAGCRHVEFGTESLAKTMLANYRKPFCAEDVLAAHARAKEARLHVAHYFLLGGPGETAETVAETLDYIKKLPRSVFFFFLGIRLYPGTELYDIALKERKITPATDLLNPVFYKADAITRGQIERLVLERAQGRANWIVGSGGTDSASLVSHLHSRGSVGPLWEYLVR